MHVIFVGPFRSDYHYILANRRDCDGFIIVFCFCMLRGRRKFAAVFIGDNCFKVVMIIYGGSRFIFFEGGMIAGGNLAGVIVTGVVGGTRT